MGSGAHRRYHVAAPLFLLLLAAASSSTAVPISRSLKTAHQQPSLAYFQSQMKNGVVNMEGRMNIEVSDYPGTGANRNHDPKPPAARV